MNTKTLVGIGALGLLVFYFLKKKKKSIDISDIKTMSSSPTPSIPLQPIVVSAKIASDDVVLKKSPMLLEDIRVPIKRPIYIAPTNSIPDVYDRGVGQPLTMKANGGQESFYNMAGYCSEHLQNACRCASKRTGKYKLDIPQLP